MRLAISAFFLLCSALCMAQSNDTALPLGPTDDPADEISCHVQEESVKTTNGTAQEYRPWLRMTQTNGRVWTQKRKLFLMQADAIRECQAWAEIALLVRDLHKRQIDQGDFVARLNGEKDTLKNQVDTLRSDLEKEIRQRTMLAGRLDGLIKQLMEASPAAQQPPPKKR